MPDKKEVESRKIIHIDMDAFYASVEQHDDPSLRGKPLAVGGSARRGVIAAASYEARKFGIHSAMPSSLAKQKCPDLVFVKPRFDRYREISQHIRRIFLDYTDLVEPLSLDEAYLDITHNKKGIPLATDIASEIRKRIFEETGLTASAGISKNKFLAKLASDERKPNGMFLIHPTKAQAFIDALPIQKFHGIGKATAQKMQKLGIHHGADLREHSLNQLVKWFGKAGHHYFNISHSHDPRPVKPNRRVKSISVERTFSESVQGLAAATAALEQLKASLVNRIAAKNATYKTVVIKLRYDDFETLSRNRSLSQHVHNAPLLFDTARELLQQCYQEHRPIRLLGLGVQNLKLPSDGKLQQLTFDF